MRDFDQERQERHAEREAALGDRQFKLGGEIFTYKANVAVDVLRSLTSDEPLTGAAYIDAIVGSCLEMIEDDNQAHKRFKAMMKRRDKDALTMDDLQVAFTGLVQEAFKPNPTQQSLPSTDGDAPTGGPSTETSSTAPAVASAA